jgi:Bacteriophage HK97-gp10, putative tail-component
MDVEVKLVGLQELEARLQELDALAGQKLLRRVLRKIAKPLADRAKAAAMGVSKSRALYHSIGTYTKREKGKQVAVIAVGSRAKQRTALAAHNVFYDRHRKGIFYGWMLDQGHGNTAARPWWTPAVGASEGTAVQAFTSELTKALDRIARRKAKTASPDTVVPA